MKEKGKANQSKYLKGKKYKEIIAKKKEGKETRKEKN